MTPGGRDFERVPRVAEAADVGEVEWLEGVGISVLAAVVGWGSVGLGPGFLALEAGA